MKKPVFLMLCLFTALTVTLGGCGGGGGSTSADLDGDGVPNTEDSFPNDPAKFASYEMKQLSSLQAGIFSVAVGINSGLQIVGMADNGNQETRAMRWTVAADGTETGQTPLKPITTNTYSAAYGINDAGVVVGESSKGTDTVAVAWPAGATATTEPAELKLLAATGPSAAHAITTSGRIVGEAADAGGRMTAVVWNTITATPASLGMISGGTFSSAYAAGDSGEVVGESEVTAGGAVHAVIWTVDSTGAVTDGPTDLGTLPGHLNSTATGVVVTSDGKLAIVGESESSSGEVHAVMWRKGLLFGYNITDLGTSGTKGSATAINSSGLIAGWSDTAGSLAAVWHAFNTTPTASTPVVTGSTSQAFGMNGTRFVVGLASDRAFVAVPK